MPFPESFPYLNQAMPEYDPAARQVRQLQRSAPLPKAETSPRAFDLSWSRLPEFPGHKVAELGSETHLHQALASPLLYRTVLVHGSIAHLDGSMSSHDSPRNPVG